MKIWLSKNSEVSVREQLVTQIALGIASNDLKTGERLASTSEISRRFRVHANTVSSAYQKLVEQGLIEFKKGSGFFVCENKPANFSEEFKLDALISQFFKTAQTLGFSNADIKTHLEKWFSIQPPDCVVVIESDENFRRILIEEIRQAIDFKVFGASFEEFRNKQQNSNAIFAAMVDEKSKIESVLRTGKTRVYLKASSVSDSLIGEKRPSSNDLIAVVSGWEKFLSWSKTILIAANVEADSIILRLASEENWQNGLQNASMIICDALTAKNFPKDRRTRIFHIIAADSIKDLQKIIGNTASI